MTVTLTELRAAYDDRDPGTNYAISKDSSKLGFGAARILESRAEMFRATQDPVYLAKGAEEIDLILATAAENTNTNKPGWGLTSPIYGGKWLPYTVHEGGAFGAIAEWCLAARTHPDWKAKADEVTAILVARFATRWDAEFRPALGGSCIILSAWNKYYSGIAPTWSLPPNQTNNWGRFLLKLFQLTGNVVYRDKAIALAKSMKATMWTLGSGWAWPYAAKMLSVDSKSRYQGYKTGTKFATDSSHANIDVAFIVDMAKAGLVFTAADLTKIAWTFLNKVYSPTAKKSFWWMSGLGTLTNDNFSGFAMLTPTNKQAGTIVWQLLNDESVGASGNTFEAATAHLARYASEGMTF